MGSAGGGMTGCGGGISVGEVWRRDGLGDGKEQVDANDEKLGLQSRVG